MKKIAVLCILICIFLVVATFIWLNFYFVLPNEKSNNKKETKITQQTSQSHWELCWFGEKRKVSRCGVVKKIKFDGTGEVLSMTVFYPTTGKTVVFRRRRKNVHGQWTQRGTTGGWWWLKKISNTNPPEYKGKCRGNDKGDKVRNLYLIKSKR